MSKAGPTHVLVVDDGELRDVRELLAGLGVPYAEARSFDAAETPGAVALLVTNARHALDSDALQSPAGMHLVVYDEVSPTLRKVLERSSCDLVLKRPVNPNSFRLLATQALYRGPERRWGRRVVISAPVKLRVAGRTQSATLIQLSLRGCGLSTDPKPRVGSEIRVTFPKELTGEGALEAAGPALAVRPSQTEPDRSEVAMAFRLMNPASRRVLADIMERHGGGAELHPRSRDAAASGATDGAGKADTASRGERRAASRRIFGGRVLAAAAGISHVLIGRELSPGGMRVRPDPDLALGDELKLAVHARPGHPAIMLKAVVARDDGEGGLVLRFHEVPPSIAARLEQIVEDLPTTSDDERAAARPGLVVSEILGLPARAVGDP